MRWREQALMLIEKAGQDLYIMQAHQDDPRVSDELWGFHAQQATEKLLKALLAHREVRYPFTHRLRELADLLEDNQIGFPDEFEPLLDLTPFAAELRYAMLPKDEAAGPLDRGTIVRLVAGLMERAVAAVG